MTNAIVESIRLPFNVSKAITYSGVMSRDASHQLLCATGLTIARMEGMKFAILHHMVAHLGHSRVTMVGVSHKRSDAMVVTIVAICLTKLGVFGFKF